jgi:hypothetical protein
MIRGSKSLGRRVLWFTGSLTDGALSTKGADVHRPKRQLASVIRFRLSPCCRFRVCTDGKIFRGDSRKFGAIRGKRVVHGVWDGTKWERLGECGTMWEKWGERGIAWEEGGAADRRDDARVPHGRGRCGGRGAGSMAGGDAGPRS